MSELTIPGKLGLVLILYALQTNIVVFGLEVNINILFWGAFGQVFALIVTYSEMEKQAREVVTFFGVLKFIANLVKGAVFSVMVTERVAAWIGFSSIYILAFFIGCFFDLLYPILTKRVKKYFYEKAVI